MLVLGNQNAGKSTGVKAYLHRQVGVFGRRGFVTDVKREYPPLAAALGGTVISLRPGAGARRGVRLNPLSPWAEHTDRLMLLYAVRRSLGRPLSSTEKALVRSLSVAEHADIGPSTGEATLPDVVRLLFRPTAEMAAQQGVTRQCSPPTPGS